MINNRKKGMTALELTGLLFGIFGIIFSVWHLNKTAKSNHLKMQNLKNIIIEEVDKTKKENSLYNSHDDLTK